MLPWLVLPFSGFADSNGCDNHPGFAAGVLPIEYTVGFDHRAIPLEDVRVLFHFGYEIDADEYKRLSEEEVLDGELFVRTGREPELPDRYYHFIDYSPVIKEREPGYHHPSESVYWYLQWACEEDPDLAQYSIQSEGYFPLMRRVGQKWLIGTESMPMRSALASSSRDNFMAVPPGESVEVGDDIVVTNHSGAELVYARRIWGTAIKQPYNLSSAIMSNAVYVTSDPDAPLVSGDGPLDVSVRFQHLLWDLPEEYRPQYSASNLRFLRVAPEPEALADFPGIEIDSHGEGWFGGSLVAEGIYYLVERN